MEDTPSGRADKAFLKNFGLIVVSLTVLTFVIVFVALSLGFKEDEDIPSRIAITAERIKPVAAVYVGDEGAAAIQQAAVEAAAPVIAFEGSLDGEMIYNNVCSACHGTDDLGAPQPGSTELAVRAENGMDSLMQNALNGLNLMPARGGRADLSDEQVKAVIEFMLK